MIKIKNVFFFLLIVGFLVLGGCATSKNYDKMLKTWHGKNINEFTSMMGEPMKTFKNPEGNMVYFYLRRNPELVLLTCETWIEANPSEIIINTRWEGGNCAAFSSD